MSFNVKFNIVYSTDYDILRLVYAARVILCLREVCIGNSCSNHLPIAANAGITLQPSDKASLSSHV